MEIYLVRHTTPDVEKGICYGQSDLDLVSTFEEEFTAIKEQLPDTNNFNIISSPLKRCTQLAKTLNTTIETDQRLKELNFGDWELKPWDAIPEKEMTPWMTDFVNVRVPNGESYIDLSERVLEFFTSLSLTTKNTVIVAHAGVLRAFLAHVLNVDLKDSFNIKINYGDCFHLKLNNNTYQLITPIHL